MRKVNLILLLIVLSAFSACYRQRDDQQLDSRYTYLYTIYEDQLTHIIDTIYLGDINKPYTMELYNNADFLWKQGDSTILRLKTTDQGSAYDSETECIGEESFIQLEKKYKLVYRTDGRIGHFYQIPWLEGNQKYNCYAYSDFAIEYFF